MNKILFIVGPTAVGKSAFALDVAEHLSQSYQIGCDLIVADSRQVYAGLEILSGADIPEQATLAGDHWSLGQHAIWGVGIAQPSDEWSVAHFRRFAQGIIERSWQTGRLPVVVGGTGLYAQFVTSTDPLLDIQPDPDIREKAANLDIEDLQNWAQRIDPSAYDLLNDSDQQNPRRLVRLLEKATTAHPLRENNVKQVVKKDENVSELYVGLTDEMDHITDRITTRVGERWQHGAKQEVERLLMIAETAGSYLPALTSTGVKQIAAYIHDQLSEEECLAQWSTAERQYAKRQLTWWKKRAGVEWFAVSEEAWQAKAKAQITAWYQS